MTNVYANELGVPLPKCCNLGSCCKGASPSTPYHQLMKRAVEGDEFARGFFSIMVPYLSHAEAEAVVPGIVARTLIAAEKQDAFASKADVVFYRCRYQTADNRCGVWEDRPKFCRDYPDTPFVVMAPGCAFEGWAKTCKEKFYALKDEVGRLKSMKQELAQLKDMQGASGQHFSDSDFTGRGASGLSGWVDKDSETDSETESGNERPSAGAVTQDRVQSTLAETAYGHPYTKIDELFRDSDNTDNLSLVLSLTGLHIASPLQSVYFIR